MFSLVVAEVQTVALDLLLDVASLPCVVEMSGAAPGSLPAEESEVVPETDVAWPARSLVVKPASVVEVVEAVMALVASPLMVEMTDVLARASIGFRNGAPGLLLSAPHFSPLMSMYL